MKKIIFTFTLLFVTSFIFIINTDALGKPSYVPNLPISIIILDESDRDSVEGAIKRWNEALNADVFILLDEYPTPDIIIEKKKKRSSNMITIFIDEDDNYLGSIITLYQNFNKLTLYNKELMLIHELGHIIGLPDIPIKNCVMNEASYPIFYFKFCQDELEIVRHTLFN